MIVIIGAVFIDILSLLYHLYHTKNPRQTKNE
jgi:hypothetical protein